MGFVFEPVYVLLDQLNMGVICVIDICSLGFLLVTPASVHCSMSTTCLRWAMSQVVTGMYHLRLSPRGPPTLFSSLRAAPCSIAAALSTTADGDGDSHPPKKKKSNAHTRSTIGSVGRKIHQRILQVIGHDGANLGTMHRADVLRLMDQEGWKLVALNENKDPPVYQLMTGKQIHEKQLKLREKQKNTPGMCTVCSV